MQQPIPQEIIGMVIEAIVDDSSYSDSDRKQVLSSYALISKSFCEAVRHHRLREISFDDESNCIDFVEWILSDEAGATTPVASHIRSLLIIQRYSSRDSSELPVIDSNNYDADYDSDDIEQPVENNSWFSLSIVGRLIGKLPQLEKLTMDNIHLESSEIVEMISATIPCKAEGPESIPFSTSMSTSTSIQGALDSLHISQVSLKECSISSLKGLVALIDFFGARGSTAFEFLDFSTCRVTLDDLERPADSDAMEASRSSTHGTRAMAFETLRLSFLPAAAKAPAIESQSQSRVVAFPQWFTNRHYSKAARTLEVRVKGFALAETMWPLVEDAALVVKGLKLIFDGKGIEERHTRALEGASITDYPSLTTLSIHITRSSSFRGVIGALQRFHSSHAPAIRTLDLSVHLRMDDSLRYDALPWGELDTVIQQGLHSLTELTLCVWYQEIEDAYDDPQPQPSEEDIERMMPLAHAKGILSVTRSELALSLEFHTASFFD
jgi:hypothetical protein